MYHRPKRLSLPKKLTNVERRVDLLRHRLQSIAVTAANLSRHPSIEANIVPSLSNIGSRDVVFRNISPLVGGSREALDVQFDNTVPQSANPFGWIAILPVIADIELHPDPRRSKLVDVFYKLVRRLIVGTVVFVQELIPDVFDP